MERSLVAGCAVLLVSSFASLAGAQEAAPTPPNAAPVAAAPSAPPPDLVRLKSGGLLRGTIAELVPGDTVTVVTVSGQTRTFPMAEVEYAGPASEAPNKASKPSEAAPAPAPAPPSEGRTKPYVTVNAADAHLHLESAPAGLTFHRQSGSATAVTYGKYGGVTEAAAYDRLCTAPCDITVPAGTETLALSQPDGSPTAAEPVTFPAGKSRLVGTLESRTGTRVGGIVLAVASLGAGLAMILPSVSSDSEKLNVPLIIGGSAVAIGGFSIGLYLGRTPDKATVTVAGATPPLPRVTGLTFSGAL